MRTQQRFLLSLLLVVSLVLAACGAKPPAPAPAGAEPAKSGQTAAGEPAKLDPIKMKIAYSAYSSVIAPLWIAADEGLFKKNGLDVELVYLEGGAKSVQGLLSGEVQIALSSADAAVNATLKGAEVEAITGCFDRYFFQIWSKKSITKVADLKGKVIAASGAGASSEAAAKAALANAGLKDGDYQITFIGSTAARLAGLEQGAVDAAVISPPDGLKAKQAGFTELINLINMDLPGGYCTLNALKPWVDSHKEAVRRFAKGYVEGVALAKQDKAMALKAIGKYTNTTDPAVLEEAYRLAIPEMKQAPYPPLDVVKDIIAKSTKPEAKGAKPESFVDGSFIKELDDSGFIGKLYTK